MMSKTVTLIISCLIIFLLLIVTLFITTSDLQYNDEKKPFDELGGDFTLMSSSGEVSLSDFRGKVVVLYFGFTHCPEVCPNSLGTIHNVFTKLSVDELAVTQGLLVSIDPDRDSAERMEVYAKSYHANIMGLTGSTQAIDAVSKQYGAYYDVNAIEADDDYRIEHSSRYYVIDAEGVLIAAMRHSTTVNELYAQIREVLGNHSADLLRLNEVI